MAGVCSVQMDFCKIGVYFVNVDGGASFCPEHSFSFYRQVEKLKEENHSLMEELVAKKMALAELSENHARLKRDLHRRAERDKARHHRWRTPLTGAPCD